MARRPPAPRWTIRVRATLGAVAVVGVALVVVSVVLLVGLRRSQVERARSAAATRAADIGAAIEEGTPVDELRLDDAEDRFVQVVDRRGDVVAASANVSGRTRLDHRATQPGDSDDQFVIAVHRADDPSGFSVIAGREIDTAGETVGPLAAMLAVAVPSLLLIVGATTWAVVGRALGPVDAIRREADAIGAAQLDRRVPEPATGDEIAALAATINQMLDRLEGSVAAQRQFVSDASHELRSPVAAIRHLTEVALAHPDRTSIEALASDVHAEDLRLQRLVEDLLSLARADEATLRIDRREVDLDDLVFADARRVRQSTTLAVDTTAVTAARVLGDEFGLGRAIRNLTDNAARHARSRVAYAVTVDGDEAVISIDDDGPGIPSDQRDKVFERFVRLDDARSRDAGGAGLGLAIARELISRHAGQIGLTESPLGGSRAQIRLPLSP